MFEAQQAPYEEKPIGILRDVLFPHCLIFGSQSLYPPREPCSTFFKTPNLNNDCILCDSFISVGSSSIPLVQMLIN